MQPSNKIPLRTKLAFGIGAAGENVAVFGFSSFVFFYYSQVLGLPGTLAGLAVTASLIVDAVTDPLMGAISDRWRSRWGRRHPFMVAAAIPVAISFFCIFSPPQGLSEWALFAWLATFSILMRLFVTMFNIPHLAFGAEMSEDYLQRSVIMSYNAIFAWVGGAGIFLLAMLALADWCNDEGECFPGVDKIAFKQNFTQGKGEVGFFKLPVRQHRTLPRACPV